MVTVSCGAAAIPPTILPGVRRLLLPLLFALLVMASCGGGNDTEDVEGLVDTAFSREMESADLKVDAEVQLEGSPVFHRPLRIQATGPFHTNEGKLPSVDLEVDGGELALVRMERSGGLDPERPVEHRAALELDLCIDLQIGALHLTAERRIDQPFDVLRIVAAAAGSHHQ